MIKPKNKPKKAFLYYMNKNGIGDTYITNLMEIYSQSF